MSEKKISELVNAEQLNNVDVIPVVQNSTTKKITVEKVSKKIGTDFISDAYDSTQTYAVGDYCIYNNILYRCTTAISTAESFDSTKWSSTSIASELANRLEFEIVDSW